MTEQQLSPPPFSARMTCLPSIWMKRLKLFIFSLTWGIG